METEKGKKPPGNKKAKKNDKNVKKLKDEGAQAKNLAKKTKEFNKQQAKDQKAKAAKNKKGKKVKKGKKDKKDKKGKKDKKHDKKGHKHKSSGTGQEFNASDFIMYPRSELDRIDHHHINCILKSSRLQSEDTHEEMLMKHEAIKNLMNKMK